MIRVFLSALLAACAVLSQTYTISTFAGQNPDGDGGPSTSVRLWRPEAVTPDGAGGFFIADSWNSRIRRVTATGVVTTVIGGGLDFAAEGMAVSRARISRPNGLAFDSRTNRLYFSDTNQIFAVNLDAGTVSLIAGAPFTGSAGDGGPAAQARLSSPWGLALDNSRNLLIADRRNNKIRRIDLTTRVITTVAGTGVAGFAGDGGPAGVAQLRGPRTLAVGRDNSIYVADYDNYRVRRIRPDGNIETVAGNGQNRFAGDNGPALQAAVDAAAVTIDGEGNLYISDRAFQRIRRVAAGSGIISTFIGTGRAGFTGDNGQANLAQVESPAEIAVDGNSLLLVDSGNHRIRRIDLASNIIRTVAGRSRFGGDDLPAAEALISYPVSVVIDSGGNVLLSDNENHVIRRVGRDGRITSVVGRGGVIGFSPESLPASQNLLAYPAGLALDTDGTLYFADYGNFRVRRLDSTGNVRTITTNDIYGPWGVAIDRRARILYFTDFVFHQIFKVDLNQQSAVPQLIAGSPDFRPGFRGDGGPASASQLRSPQGITVAPNGDIYFCDTGNNRIRKIDTAGNISTVIGNGELEFEALDGPITGAAASTPNDVALDAQGNIFFVEGFSRVRRISGNRVDTIAGQRSLASGFAGDGGLATAARVDFPLGLALDPNGNIYLADTYNQRIRLLSVVRQLAPASIQITRGNNQTGTVGTALATPLTVRVLAANNDPVAGLRVTFTVLQGSATLSASTINTGADGTASVNVTLGSTAGTVQVSARVEGLSPAVFSLTATAATGGGGTTGPPRPAIARQGIIGVGSSVPAVRLLSPRGIVSIFGQNFLPAGTNGRRVNFDTELVNGLLPTRLLGVCVEIGALRAPLLDVFATQLNVVVPNLATANAAVRVITNCDAPVGELISDPEMVPVAPAAPEFLYSQINANGRNPVAAANAVTGALIGPSDLPGFVPAQPGDILTIYATGLGATDPQIAAGGFSAGIANVTGGVRIELGDTPLAASDILYVGASPGSLIYQINLRVPAGTTPGNQTLRIFIGESGSPANAFLAIAAPE